MELSEKEIAQLIRVVRWHLKDYAGRRDWEDLLQVGLIGMWRSVSGAPAHGPHRMTTLACQGAMWAVQDYLRSRHNATRRVTRSGRGVPELVPFSESEEELSDNRENPASLSLSRLAAKRVTNELADFLAGDALAREIIERTVLDDERDADVALSMQLSLVLLRRVRELTLTLFRRVSEERGNDDD